MPYVRLDVVYKESFNLYIFALEYIYNNVLLKRVLPLSYQIHVTCFVE